MARLNIAFLLINTQDEPHIILVVEFATIFPIDLIGLLLPFYNNELL